METHSALPVIKIKEAMGAHRMNQKNHLILQDHYAPNSICFGCGPSNEKGLQIKSYIQGEESLCQWVPQVHHEAFPGVLNGGIIGSLLDCHCNWMAAWHLMSVNHLDHPTCTVTASYSIHLRRPTPSSETVHLRAWVAQFEVDRATVHGELSVGGKVCATCKGLFVAVKEGHLAFHRWA